VAVTVTIRKWMAVVCILAITFWIVIALFRTVPVRPHMRPNRSIGGVFDYDWSYCHRRPFLPKFWRLLLGRQWPGNYICPDHPADEYVEDPSL
jgi:hypothetical protein